MSTADDGYLRWATREANDEADGSASRASRDIGYGCAAHVSSPKGVNATAAMALASECAGGADKRPTHYTNRQQLLQRLRDAPRAHSSTAAADDFVIDQQVDRAGWEIPTRTELPARGDEQGGFHCSPTDARAEAGDMHAADDGDPSAAVGAEIRGRSSPPGAAGPSAPQGFVDHDGVAAGRIRGPPMGLGAQRVNPALPGRRDDIAKRRPSPEPGGALSTASERIAAIRRRLGTRAAARAEHVNVPATGAAEGADVELHSQTKEVSKIHYPLRGVGGCSGASSGPTSGAGDARAHAAAVRAWHGREPREVAGTLTQPGA